MDATALQRKRRERAAFHELLDRPPSARETRLAEYERDDPVLARALRATLAAADADVAADAASGDRADAEVCAEENRTPTVVGRFRLIRLLGIGGMGEVYLAERIDDVQQRVALKLVRNDLPISHARARRERQILAKLNHSHIAGLVDAGIAESGQPWFAMEYVEGERITDWCDRRRLDLRARVRLLARVCTAVQYAHTNLVLHRDLKPSNILVGAEGTPKLLDFGIAKLLDATDELETQTLALTPAYAAPERLRGEAATTASDVYQLGLVMYELAGGVTARNARAAAPHPDMTSSLPRLGQMLTALGKSDQSAADHIARQRDTGLDRLRRQLSGDFARIIAKATENDPQARYATAQALADDLERWADGLPVSAYRGSFAYRFAKLVRRHTLAAAAMLLLSLGMLATTLIALDRSYHEREQRERAEHQREVAEAQHQLADQQRQRAETLVAFLNDVFREGDPNRTQGAALSAADLLNRASAKLNLRTDLSDATRAALLTEIADVFNNLGNTPQALDAAQRAHALLEPQRNRFPIEYLQNVAILAQICIQDSRHREAAQVIEAALPLARHTVGGQHRWHPYLLAVRAYALLFLARGAEAETEATAAIEEFDEAGDDRSQDLLETLGTAAAILDQHGDPKRSSALYDRAMAVIDANPGIEQTSVLRTIANKGGHEYALGNTKAAIATFTSLLPRFESMLGPTDFGTFVVRSRLVTAYLAIGDYTRAREQLAAIDVAITTGEKNATIVPGMQQRVETARARFLIATGRFAEAEKRMNELLASLQSKEQSKNTRANQRRVLAEAVLQQRRPREAIDLLQSALSELDAPNNLNLMTVTAATEDSLGRAYLLERDARSLPHLQRAVTLFRKSQGPDKPSTLRSEIHLLWARAAMARDAAALNELTGKRAELVAALEGETVPQVWQLDLLIDQLDREFGRRGIDPLRRAEAQAGLAQITGTDPPPRFVGLTDF